MLGSHQRQSQVAGAVSRQDPAARIAGALLVLTAVITAISALGRVAADADQPTLAETLSAISLKSGLYGLGGAARFVAGVTLVAAAWYLLRTWIIRERLDTPLVPTLFAVSGAFTIVSGVCAVILAVSAPDVRPTHRVIRVSPVAYRQDRVRHRGIGAGCRGQVPVEGGWPIEIHRCDVGDYRSGDAVHLDRRRNHGASDRGGRLFRLAPGGGNNALQRTDRIALCPDGQLRLFT